MITITQTPHIWNLAYGVNPVTLSGLTSQDKYLLQIKVGGNVIADVRQSPNQSGVAQFDIQNILQTYVENSDVTIETIAKWHNSDEEIVEYAISYGSESNGVPNIDGTSTGFIAMGGRKNYWDLFWDVEEYRAQVGADGESPCTIIEVPGKALTDYTDYKLISQVSDETPDWSSPTDKVYTQKVRRSDNFTLSVVNSVTYGPIAPEPNVKGIEAYRVTAYDEFGTLVTDFPVLNIVSNGGGPNETLYEGLTIRDPFHVVTAGVGPANLGVLLPSAVKYYYVGFPVGTPEICGTDEDFLTDASAVGFYRFDIVEDDCNDFTPIQFSWTNSLGFRDYFHFTKRNDRSVNIQRDTFLKENNDWNGSTFSLSRNRRGTTTYSQTLQETFTANTRFMTDFEATFLENLFISPDVRVRFGDSTEWYPVVITDTDYTEKTFRKDRLFQYTVNFKMATNLKSQRG